MNPRGMEVKSKVKVTIEQAAITAKQAASWRRLWERLLSQGEVKRGEDNNGKH